MGRRKIQNLCKSGKSEKSEIYWIMGGNVQSWKTGMIGKSGESANSDKNWESWENREKWETWGKWAEYPWENDNLRNTVEAEKVGKQEKFENRENWKTGKCVKKVKV